MPREAPASIRSASATTFFFPSETVQIHVKSIVCSCRSALISFSVIFFRPSYITIIPKGVPFFTPKGLLTDPNSHGFSPRSPARPTAPRCRPCTDDPARDSGFHNTENKEQGFLKTPRFPPVIAILQNDSSHCTKITLEYRTKLSHARGLNRDPQKDDNAE